MEAHFASERRTAKGADSSKKDVSDAFWKAPPASVDNGSHQVEPID